MNNSVKAKYEPIQRKRRRNMTVLNYVLGMYKTNCYLLYTSEGAVIIDPADRSPYLISKLEEKSLKLHKILLTHAHFDHILAANPLKDETGAEICIGTQDAEGARDVERSYLLQLGRTNRGVYADTLLNDGDTFSVCGMDFTVIETPGHTKGSVCYVCGNDIFCGDTVFKDGFGRCDLYGGDEEKMVSSLLTLRKFFEENGTDYVLHPGHGGKLSAEYFIKQTEFLKRGKI